MQQSPNSCKKHPSNEIASFCRKCNRFMCLECILDHDVSFADHKSTTMPELAVAAIKALDKETSQRGSFDAFQQEFISLDSKLSEKIRATKECAEQIQTVVIRALNEYIAAQLSAAEAAGREFDRVKERVACTAQRLEQIPKDAIMIKQLYTQKDFPGLLALHDRIMETARPVPVSLEEEKTSFAQKLGWMQVLDFGNVKAKIQAEVASALAKFQILCECCSACKKEEKGMVMKKACAMHKINICPECEAACGKCKVCVCKKCLVSVACAKCGVNEDTMCDRCIQRCEKCEKLIKCVSCDAVCKKCSNVCCGCAKTCKICMRKMCEKCHVNCKRYVWYDESEVCDRSKRDSVLISTKLPLPNAFRAELEVKNCTGSCWSIGIAGKQFDGFNGMPNGTRSNCLLGWVQGLAWQEYGWAACSCSVKNTNGTTINSYANQIVTGKLALTLDKERNLIGEIDGLSQGVMYTGVPKGEYYLTFSSTRSNGEIKILSVTEL